MGDMTEPWSISFSGAHILHYYFLRYQVNQFAVSLHSSPNPLTACCRLHIYTCRCSQICICPNNYICCWWIFNRSCAPIFCEGMTQNGIQRKKKYLAELKLTSQAKRGPLVFVITTKLQLIKWLSDWEIEVPKGEGTMHGASLLAVYRQVVAHLWHWGPVVSRQLRDANLGPLVLDASGRRSNQLSYLLLLLYSIFTLSNFTVSLGGRSIRGLYTSALAEVLNRLKEQQD